MPKPTEERSCLRCGHAEIEHMHHRGTDCSHYDLARGVITVRVQCPCTHFESNHIVWRLHRVWWRLSAILRPLKTK